MSAHHYTLGYAMGLRHARTGDPRDTSHVRCLPLEHERDEAARACDPRAVFGSEDFHAGYDDGYEAVVGDD